MGVVGWIMWVDGWMCPRIGGGRVDVTTFWGCPSGCVGVLGMDGWMCPRDGGDRVVGGCVPGLGVTGWVCR